jgi:hypothetical protein
MPVDKNHFILACFLEASRRSEFQHRWMSAETWAQLIVKCTLITNTELVFNGVELNRCINAKKNSLIRSEMEDRVKITSDPIGIFRNNRRLRGASITYYYYATPKGELPVTRQDKQWFENISDGKDLLNIVLTRSDDLIVISPRMISNLYPQPTKKRKLQVAFIEAPPLPTSTDGNQQSLISSQIRSLPPAPQSPNIWWESPEAKKLFKAQEGESTIHAVLEQIDILKNVNRTESSYLSIISGGEKADKPHTEMPCRDGR